MEPSYLAQILFNVTQNISNQNLTVDNMDSDSEDPTPGLLINDLFFAILYGLMFLLGTPGNVLVIWIAGFKMKTINAVWILHLAIADLICCMFLPFLSAYYFDYIRIQYLYITGHSAVSLSVFASVTILAAMSIDRCISVMCPLWYKMHRTSKHVHMTAAVIWVLSLFVAGFQIYSYIYANLSKPPIEYVLIGLLTLCFTIIITCYAQICFKIKKMKMPNRPQRSYRVITALVICFSICWGPYYIYQIISGYLRWVIDEMLYDISFCLACLNSCINPIIYVFIGLDFKETLMESLPPGIQRAINKCCNQTLIIISVSDTKDIYYRDV